MGGGAVKGSGGGPGSLTNDQFLKSVSFWRSWREVCQGLTELGPLKIATTSHDNHMGSLFVPAAWSCMKKDEPAYNHKKVS